jgi:hypothetical protein
VRPVYAGQRGGGGDEGRQTAVVLLLFYPGAAAQIPGGRSGALTVADIKARVQEQDAQWDLARQRIIFQVGLQAPSPCL